MQKFGRLKNFFWEPNENAHIHTTLVWDPCTCLRKHQSLDTQSTATVSNATRVWLRLTKQFPPGFHNSLREVYMKETTITKQYYQYIALIKADASPVSRFRSRCLNRLSSAKCRRSHLQKAKRKYRKHVWNSANELIVR